MMDTPSDKRAPLLTVHLAARLHKALTAGSEELFQVMLDPAAEVLRAALKNPALGEEHLLALLKRRDLPEELLKSVSQLEPCHAGHRLQYALASNPGTPASVAATLLPRLFLFELLNIALLPGPTPDQKVAAERLILQRLPSLELGAKLTLARRGTATLVGELLKEGHPRLVEICLDSPQLREAAVLQFLNGPLATAETISRIARHPRWQRSHSLRLAILRHHRTPAVWYTLFLPQLTLAEVKSLTIGKRLNPSQRQLLQDELQRRSGRR